MLSVGQDTGSASPDSRSPSRKRFIRIVEECKLIELPVTPRGAGDKHFRVAEEQQGRNRTPLPYLLDLCTV